jgi:GntR family transcriptional regulator
MRADCVDGLSESGKEIYVNRTSARGPKYLPVYKELRGRLDRGDLPIGALLPAEDRLCSQFGVTRYTLREALRILEREGFIQRRRRAGTRVLARPSKHLFSYATGSRIDFLEFVSATTIDYSVPRLIQTDGKLARFLGCDELKQWYLLEGVRIDAGDRRPVCITQAYADASRVTIAPNVDFGQRPVFEWIEKTHNIRTTFVSQDISAVLLTPAEAEVFGEHRGAPSLRIMRRYFDANQKNFFMTVNTHRGEDFVFNTRVHLE